MKMINYAEEEIPDGPIDYLHFKPCDDVNEWEKLRLSLDVVSTPFFAPETVVY